MLSKFSLYLVCIFVLSSCTNNVNKETSDNLNTVNVQTVPLELTRKFCEKQLKENPNIRSSLKKYCLKQFPTKIKIAGKKNITSAKNTKVKIDPWRHSHTFDYKICKDKIFHKHKFKNKKHKHYLTGGCWVKLQKRKPIINVDVRALQRKLKAKGYYKGSIHGVVNTETREALTNYMENRNLK